MKPGIYQTPGNPVQGEMRHYSDRGRSSITTDDVCRDIADLPEMIGDSFDVARVNDPKGPPMDPRLFAQIRRDEGEVLHAYKCSQGFLTIGVGRLIDKARGGGITREEAAYLLANDLRRIDSDLRERFEWFAALDVVRQAALVNMAFQLGTDGLAKFKRTLDCVRDGRYYEAETHALDSLWAVQTPQRARRVARQLATGEWQ